MEFEDFNINRFLQKNSSRHHYIPRYLIEGFKNTNGLLYVYDKKHNKILKKPKPPKSIFYEWDRNTVEVTQNKESSILEDYLYSKMDNELSETVKQFQEEELYKIEFTSENTQYFKCFIITLFWRIPYSDFAAEDLMDHATIISPGINPEILRSDSTYRKLQRPGLIPHTLKTMNSGKKWVNIHSWPNDITLIGDNPILFRKDPSSFSEFGEVDFLIAITSRRIYSSIKKKLENFNFLNFYRYNAAIINQSKRFACCSNIEALQKSIQLYNEYKNRGITFMLPEDAFETY